MYEARFGLTGAPFRISPDPAFYFDSNAHREALAALRREFASDAAFAVLGGEIGAGKTTIVRKLLEEREPELGPVARLCSTQLSAEELLCSAAVGLGAPQAQAGAELARRGLEQLFEALALQKRRALLVIDEAQHLRQDALAVLQELASQRPHDAIVFQALLVGQGSLHHLLPVAALRGAAVAQIGAVHLLGPLARDETADYIRHRLGCVGWSGQPGLAADAADEIFARTGGVPRRINVLCGRLLLACALESRPSIDAALVGMTADELQVELAGRGGAEAPAGVRQKAKVRARAIAADMASPVRRARTRVSSALRLQVMPAVGPLLCAVASADEHVLAAPLLRALRERAELPAARLLRLRVNDAMTTHAGLLAELDPMARHIELGVDEATNGGAGVAAGEVGRRFASVVERLGPSGLIVIGGRDPVSQACARVAREMGLPVIGVDGGGLDRHGGVGDVALDDAAERPEPADLCYASDSAATVELRLLGVPPSRIVCVGNLRIDAVRLALHAEGVDWADTAAGGRRGAAVGAQQGFGLVALDHLAAMQDARAFADQVAILREISHDIALLWPIDRHLAQRLVELDLQRAIDKERIVCMPMLGYPNFIQLLRNARCVLTDSVAVEQAARVLGTPSARLAVSHANVGARGRGLAGFDLYRATRDIWNLLFNGGAVAELPPLWDGRSAERLAADLARRPLRGRALLLQPAEADLQSHAA